MSTRADMARHLRLDLKAPTKTFVLEAHTDEPGAYLGELAGDRNIEPTEDAYLFRVHLPEGMFWVDQLDERFWSFHTDMPTQEAYAFLRDHVETRRDLDWMWLPSLHLRHAWPGASARRVSTNFQGQGFLGDTAAARDLRVRLSGRDADALLDYIADNQDYRSAVSFDGIQTYLSSPEFGWIDEGLNRMGRFAVSGNSLEFHLQFVRTVVRRYRELVTLCEQKAISWAPYDDSGDGGGYLQGHPIAIQFSREIEDLQNFLDNLFAVRRPFRLWGIPQVIDGIAEVEAVDLHIGQRVRMDIGTTWMRVYLEAGSCGNSVARLISNLQHHFDGALSFVDPDLQAAMEARPAALPG